MRKSHVLFIGIAVAIVLYASYNIYLATRLRFQKCDCPKANPPIVITAPCPQQSSIVAPQPMPPKNDEPQQPPKTIPDPGSTKGDDDPSVPQLLPPDVPIEPVDLLKTPIEDRVNVEDYHPKIKELAQRIVATHAQSNPKDFAIAIVAADRPEYLRTCLRSLRQVLYWDQAKTVVFQYGNSPRVNEVVNEFGIRQVKNKVLTEHNGAPIYDGAMHIALHYKFVLGRMFELNPDVPYFIVVEDDMIFSPDFLLYFAQVAHMSNDPTTYAISAYNDNGFYGLAKYDNVVYKTDFFIGLGWLVNRKLWENEWQHKWPNTHWDHFLREEGNRQGRKIIYPEVPRVYHIGYRGTHSNLAMFEKYFRNIKLNLNGYAPLGLGDNFQMKMSKSMPLTSYSLDYLAESKYDEMMRYYLAPSEKTIYISSLDQLKDQKNMHIVIGYQAPNTFANHEFYKIAAYFGIWHSTPIRAEYMGVVMLRWASNLVFVVATYSKYYVRENFHNLLSPEDFSRGAGDKWIAPRIGSAVKVVVANKGQSCASACIARFGANSKCDLFAMSNQLNNCKALEHHFQGKCKKCYGSIGFDQPALDTDDHSCLFNTGGNANYMTTCEGAHEKTQRICACFERDQVDMYHAEWQVIIGRAKAEATKPALE